MPKFWALPCIAGILCASLLLGCSGDGRAKRAETAAGIASSASMNRQGIAAAPFLLTAFVRIGDHGKAANVYIEGDGRAWLSRRAPSRNPTPTDPIALRLATKDWAENVIYLARPCQYSLMLDENAPCPEAYWTDRRFAPEVIQSYNQALDDLARRDALQGFHLIGFSGGAGIAALLAAQRRDVLSLRTVAGNLDHKAHSLHHGVSILGGSLNPVDYAAALGRIPQRHFIGARDSVVPLQIFRSYADRLPSRDCTSHQVVAGTTHTEGWEERWSALLQQPLRCSVTRGSGNQE